MLTTSTAHARASSEAADLTKMCACPCHDSMYQLVRNTIAVLNRDQRNNPYQFTHDADT